MIFMIVASSSHTQKIATKIIDNATGDVVLPNISWQTYQAILEDIGDRSSVRFLANKRKPRALTVLL
jgi:hypothetical protein